MIFFLAIVVIGALGLMFMTMVFDSNPFERKNDLGDAVIHILETKSGWIFEQHTISLNGLRIWTSNRPYADLTVGNVRIGNMWQRRKIRKLIDRMKAAAIIRMASEVKKHAKK